MNEQKHVHNRKIKIKSKKILQAMFVFICAFLCSCVSTEVKEVTKLIWPAPPEEPRIAYLTSYKGESDFKKKNIIETVIGEAMFSRDLQKPYGVTAYGNKMYVTDTQSAVVFVFDFKEQKVAFLGQKDMGKLTLPTGIAITSNGIIFVSDTKQKRVFGYDDNGTLKIALGKKDEFKNPGGLAVNNALERLYIVDSYGHMVHVYSTKGEPLFTFGKRGNGDGEFNYPSNIAIDRKTGNVYIVDTQNFRVQVFDKDGKFIKRFGQIGDFPGTFTRPKGIGIDSEGHVYVVDAAFDNLQIFDDNGQILLFIGGPGHEPGYFWLPAGAYIDEQDKIYIVDTFNHRVQIFQYFSEKWKKENPEKYKEYILK